MVEDIEKALSAEDERAASRYRWTALANTTAAMFMFALDGSIVLIALPRSSAGSISIRSRAAASRICSG